MNYKIGDYVLIKKYNGWSSHCASNCPRSLSYPIKGTITKMGISKVTGFTTIAVAIQNIEYGFSLSSLINADNIEHDIIQLRKKKLSELK